MKRQRCNEPGSESGIDLKLTPTSEPKTGSSKTIRARIKRLMSQNPVIIFSRPSCFMFHVMKSLLSAVGAHPTVIELEEEEVSVAAKVCGQMFVTPSLFIGGKCVGGLESMVGLHLRNDLVLRLEEVGALNKGKEEVLDEVARVEVMSSSEKSKVAKVSKPDGLICFGKKSLHLKV